jgi:hypothetical protein
METPSEKHNRLAREFVMMAGRETRDQAELMVLVESAITASMLLLVRQHSLNPSHASTFIESAVQNATERFSQIVREAPRD